MYTIINDSARKQLAYTPVITSTMEPMCILQEDGHEKKKCNITMNELNSQSYPSYRTIEQISSISQDESEKQLKKEKMEASSNKSTSISTAFLMGTISIFGGVLMILFSLLPLWPTRFVSKDMFILLLFGSFFVFTGLVVLIVDKIITVKAEKNQSRAVFSYCMKQL